MVLERTTERQKAKGKREREKAKAKRDKGKGKRRKRKGKRRKGTGISGSVHAGQHPPSCGPPIRLVLGTKCRHQCAFLPGNGEREIRSAHDREERASGDH